jgi:hypothetical protein
MTGYWSLIVPEYERNLFTNPSFETNTAGATEMAGVVARSNLASKRGGWSLEVTPGVSVGDGAYLTLSSLLSGTYYTVAFDFLGAAGISYTSFFATTGGVQKGTELDFTGDAKWHRYSVTWQADADATFRFYIVKNNYAVVSPYYIDGVKLTAKSYDTTYFDGDTPECRWVGAPHGSMSERSASVRTGGREYNLDSYSFYVTEAPGIGYPNNEHIIQEQALLPGDLLVGLKTKSRVFTLVPEQLGDSRTDLHLKRKQLIDALKPDRVAASTQPVVLRYTGANPLRPIEISCHVDQGLDWSKIEGYSSQDPIRFVAYDPFFYEDGNAAAHLTTQTTLSGGQGIIARVDGSWSTMGGGVSGYPYAIQDWHNGKVLVGGNFSAIAGTSISAANIGVWDRASGTWGTLGPGFDGVVNAIVPAPDGVTVYIGGAFSNTYGGTGDTCRKIAYWDGIAIREFNHGVYGDVLGNEVKAIALDRDGNVIVGGQFGTAGDTPGFSNVAKWDITVHEWSSMGGGLNDGVWGLTLGPDGYIYAVGSFDSTAGGTAGTLNAFARWNGTEWVEPASGLLVALRMVLGSRGDVLIRGRTPLETDPKIFRWNGGSLQAIEAHLRDNQNIWDLVEVREGVVLAVGTMWPSSQTDQDAVTNDHAFLWNGSEAVPIGCHVPTWGITHVGVDDVGNWYLETGADLTCLAEASTIVNNEGTRAAAPVIKIKRSGGTSARLVWISNETSGKYLFSDYALLDGEMLTIDLRPHLRTATSSYFGRVLRALYRSSDVSSFELLPGENDIHVFIRTTGDPTLECWMEWRNTHWSADGPAE